MAPVEPDLSNRGERFVPGETHGELIETEHLARYWWATQLAAGRRVLDAGCGVGYGTAMLARAGATEVIGVDVSPEVVSAAAASAPERAAFQEADLRALPFDDARFDLVVCFEVIEHLLEQDAVIAELARVLAPAGVLAISSPNRDVYPEGNPHHVHEYVPDELRAALELVFPEIALYRQHDWTTSAVLDDAQAADESLSDLAGLRAGKVFAQAAGSEAYTIALAGHEPLPQARGTAVLGAASEVRAWLTELRELRDARNYDRTVIAALTDERDRARADVATLQGIEAQLRVEHEQVRAVLRDVHAALREVHASLPWRAVQFARAARARVRPRG